MRNVPSLFYGCMAYLLALHLFVGLALVKSDIVPLVEKNLGMAPARSESIYYHSGMVDYQLRLDATLPAGRVILFGASHMQSVDSAQVAPDAVNYGIGGDTTTDLIRRIPLYKSLPKARAIVLEVGYGDLRLGSPEATLARFRRLFALLPAHVPLVLSSVLPIDERAPHYLAWPGRTNDTIRVLNHGLAALCAGRPRCVFANANPQLVDEVGRLQPRFHGSDGVHLTPPGYVIWTAELRKQLRALLQPDDGLVGSELPRGMTGGG